MRNRNWKDYNKNLVDRGSISFLIDPKLLKKSRLKSTGGRPREFSDQLIVMLMMIKVHFRIAYRFLEGFVKSIIKHTSLPSYSLICKRAAGLELPQLSSSRPQVIVVDSSGVKVMGEGEWKVKVHGASKRRRWVKVHIGIDARTQEIVALCTTQGNVSDDSQAEALLNQIPRSVKTVLADGAYDRKHVRQAIHAKGSSAVIPPPKNGRLGDDHERNDAIRIIRGLGGDKEARSLWGKLIGYSLRVLVETTFSRMKRLFGERLFSKLFDKQEVENKIRCLLLNKMMRATRRTMPT